MAPAQVRPGSIYLYHDVDFNLRRDVPVPTTGQQVEIYQPEHMPRADLPCCFVRNALTGESLGLVPLMGLDRCVRLVVDSITTTFHGPCD